MTDSQKLPYTTSVFNIPPPSYDEAQQTIFFLNSAKQSLQLIPTPSINSSSFFKPIVIPQTSKSFRGVFFSPFSRPYSPSLADSIPVQDFITFIDGLKEAFIAAPAFQVVSYLGQAITFVPFHPVMFAGIGLQAGAGLASTATSWARARKFVKTANEEIFEPRGLKCKVLKTGKMTVAVGHGEEVLSLPPLEDKVAFDSEGGMAEGDNKDDPLMRRVSALGDSVAPLTFNGLPEPETMENWWKRMGSKQAQKKDAQMHKRLMKQREEGFKKLGEGMSEAEEEGLEHDREIFKIQRKQMKQQEKVERKLSGKKGMDPEERAKVEREFAKEMRKLDREVGKVTREKEERVGQKTQEGQREVREAEKKKQRIAQKIYWIVIDRAEVLDQEVGMDDVESLESK